MICPDCEIEVGEVEQCPKCQLDLTVFNEEGLTKLQRGLSLIEKRRKAKAEAERKQKQQQEQEAKKKKTTGFWKGLGLG